MPTQGRSYKSPAVSRHGNLSRTEEACLIAVALQNCCRFQAKPSSPCLPVAIIRPRDEPVVGNRLVPCAMYR
jgi:hypothetical protein